MIMVREMIVGFKAAICHCCLLSRSSVHGNPQ